MTLRSLSVICLLGFLASCTGTNPSSPTTNFVNVTNMTSVSQTNVTVVNVTNTVMTNLYLATNGGTTVLVFAAPFTTNTLGVTLLGLPGHRIYHSNIHSTSSVRWLWKGTNSSGTLFYYYMPDNAVPNIYFLWQEGFVDVEPTRWMAWSGTYTLLTNILFIQN